MRLLPVAAAGLGLSISKPPALAKCDLHCPVPRGNEMTCFLCLIQNPPETSQQTAWEIRSVLLPALGAPPLRVFIPERTKSTLSRFYKLREQGCQILFMGEETGRWFVLQTAGYWVITFL